MKTCSRCGAKGLLWDWNAGEQGGYVEVLETEDAFVTRLHDCPKDPAKLKAERKAQTLAAVEGLESGPVVRRTVSLEELKARLAKRRSRR